MPFKVDITAENVKFLRDQTGFGLMQCREAMDHAMTDEFGGDVVLGIAYIHVGGFTTGHGNRLRKAVSHAEYLRERHPDLDARFPKPPAVG